MFSFITLPNDFVANIGSSTTDMISSFSPFLTLILGVLLAGVVISLIIGAVTHR